MLLSTFLKSTIHQVGNKVRMLNAGGCGIFALALSDELDKLGVEYKIAYVDRLRCHSNFDEKREIFEEMNTKSGFNPCLEELCNAELCNTHIMIELDGKFIDGEGVYDNPNEVEGMNNRYEVIGHVSRECLDEMVYGSGEGCWCSVFDRDNTEFIDEKVAEIMNKYSKKYIHNSLEV